MITKEEKQLFVEVYMENYASLRIAEGEDLHQEFANRLGISRQEAKSLCHRINYTLGFPVFH